MNIDSIWKKILFGVLLPVLLILAPFTPSASTVEAQTIPAPVQQKCGSLRIVQNANGTYSCTLSTGDTATVFTYDGQGNPANDPNGIQTLAAGPAGVTLAQDKTGKNVTPPTSCSGFINYAGNLSTCLFRTFVSLTGSVLMSLTAWLLGVSGLLFNWVISNTVVSFGSLYGQVQQGVVAAWSTFRDIANILIIGVFVFVAISFILGLQEYGQKKYVARILVIAVLINFSLLFTEMIIDFSNFTAGQFYSVISNQIVGNGAPSQSSISFTQSGSGTNSTDPNAQAASTGIAGTFIAMTGVSGFAGYYNSLGSIAETNDSGWLALLHGLVVATLFLMAALVLLYGSYILIVRAILLIFVLLTSSIAFATYIIPGQSFVKEGWSKWWSSLIRSAVLAPLLMVFLWATANIGTTLSHGTNGVSLASLSTNPPTGTSIQLLFNYFIILGLLFASFKVASSVSSSIAGFNWPAAIATGAFGLASRFAIAPALRQTAGRGFMTLAEGKGSEAKAARDRLAQLELDGKKGTAEYEQAKRESAKLRLQATRASGYANSRFNIMDRNAPKALAKALGVSGVFAGASSKETKGYAGIVEERAKAAEKIASKLAPSSEDREKIERATKDRERKQREAETERLKKQIDGTKETLKPIAEAVESFKQLQTTQAEQTQRNNELEALRVESANKTADHASKIAELQNRADAENDQAKKGALQNDIQTRQRDRESEMRQEASRIADAQKKTTELTAAVAEAQRKFDATQTNEGVNGMTLAQQQSRAEELRKEVEARERELDNYKTATKEAVTSAGKKAVHSLDEATSEIAEEVGRRYGTVWQRAFGSVTGINERAAEETKDLYKKRQGTKRFRAALEQAREEEGGGGAEAAEHH